MVVRAVGSACRLNFGSRPLHSATLRRGSFIGGIKKKLDGATLCSTAIFAVFIRNPLGPPYGKGMIVLHEALFPL